MGGFGGHPPLRTRKEMETPLLKRSAFFHTKIAKIAITFFCAIQLAYIISRNFYCDAIILVVRLFWCIALEAMPDSKDKPGEGQWAMLKLQSCCDGIKQLFSSAVAGQDNVLAQKRILGKEWLQRRQIIRLQCHNFDLSYPASCVVVKVIAVGARNFGFDFWAGTGH